MPVTDLTSRAVVLEAPHRLRVSELALTAPVDTDVVVDIHHSGISTGTERLLWSGQMPSFPGMGYPLVPGYESVGSIRYAGPASGRTVGDHVFVPGANCYGAVRGLFGGASSTIVVPGNRVTVCPDTLGARAVLLALAATAFHAIHPQAAHGPGAHSQNPGSGTVKAPPRTPDLIVGHGVLGRLLARIALLTGDGHSAPTVWETNADRRTGSEGYQVLGPTTDARRDYRCIYDCSGDAAILDSLIQRLAPGGEITLAGFYHQPLSFAFPPAFMREASIRVAAQWQPSDLAAVTALATSGQLSLDGLLTHTAHADDAPAAYMTAFTDASCLKMVLNWRHTS